MPVGLLTLEIQIPYSHSLKEKRAILQKLESRLRQKFNVAAAELDHHDLWQRATVGLVSLSNSQPVTESLLQRVLAEAEKILGHDVDHYTLEFF